MSEESTCFYCGTLEVGRSDDWDRVAKVFDLMRACDIRIEPKNALVRDDGSASVPFFAVDTPNLMPIGGCKSLRRRIEELSPWRLGTYRAVDPKKAPGEALGALAKLSRDRGEAAVRAGDVRPRARTGKAGDAFEGLVGLRAQRELLAKACNLVAKHGRTSLECLHMVFSGPPGTGKTELARRLSAHLDALGVTDGRGIFVKAGAADLVAHYVGQTPARTRAVVERALGGVLFVDEVYSLLAADDYGQEAIDTLVEMLEEERGRLVCVVAGYPDELERVFARNPGLRERFALRVGFDDYTVDELEQIFHRFAADKGFQVAEGASGELRRVLGALREARDFANARTVRRLFDRTAMELAMRSDSRTVEARDLHAAFCAPDLGGEGNRRARVGF